MIEELASLTTKVHSPHPYPGSVGPSYRRKPEPISLPDERSLPTSASRASIVCLDWFVWLNLYACSSMMSLSGKVSV